MKIKDIIWNIAGLGMPLFVAILTIPPLLRAIGQEKFGILTLVWGLAAYVGMFDLGIGKAATQYLAKLRGNKENSKIILVVETARSLAIYCGVIGGLLLLILVFSGTYKYISFSPELDSELFYTGILVAIMIPLQATASLYRGINEAFEDFKLISIIKMFIGSFNFIGPLFFAYFTHNLAFLVLPLLLSRFIGLYAFNIASRKHTNPYKNNKQIYSRFELKEIINNLLNFGGWLTVSNFVGPILVQADRFVIAIMLGASFVASYTIPYEIVIQTLIIVMAISYVAFPNLSLELNRDRKAAIKIFYQWLKYISILMLILCLILAISLPKILPMWIGNELPENSIEIGQILSLGIFVNCIGMMYYTLLQSDGRSDLTAKIHLLELPFYLYLLVFLINKFGVIGAAVAWVVRVSVDLSLLIYFSNKTIIFKKEI